MAHQADIGELHQITDQNIAQVLLPHLPSNAGWGLLLKIFSGTAPEFPLKIPVKIRIIPKAAALCSHKQTAPSFYLLLQHFKPHLLYELVNRHFLISP